MLVCVSSHWASHTHTHTQEASMLILGFSPPEHNKTEDSTYVLIKSHDPTVSDVYTWAPEHLGNQMAYHTYLPR